MKYFFNKIICIINQSKIIKTFYRNTRITLKYIVWELVGLRAIYERIVPPPNSESNSPAYKAAPSIGIWLFSIYFAVLGFATARYERKLERAEFNYNTLTTQLAADMQFREIRVSEVGNLKIPIEPKFELNNTNFIISVWKSLFSESRPYRERHDRITFNEEDAKITIKPVETESDFLILMVELWKHKLNRAYLAKSQLNGASLFNSVFTNADLRDADLSNSDLREANLSKSDSRGAIFKKANLEKANLLSADLRGADFDEANLDEAIMENTRLSANLNKASLMLTVLTGSDLSNATLVETELSGADLTKTKLNHCDMKEANLYEANLTEVSLFRTILTDADLTSTILADAVLFEVNMTKTVLRNTNFSGARIANTFFPSFNIEEVIFKNATLHNSDLSKMKYTSDAEAIQLISEAKSLTGCKLPDGFIEILRTKKPSLFVDPYDESQFIKRETHIF